MAKSLVCVAAILCLSASAFGKSAESETSAPDTEVKPAAEPKDEPESAVAEDEYGWDAGRVRLEGTAAGSWYSGRQQRGGDVSFRILVDYEIPVREHFTVGPRVMPFMFYNENHAGDNDIYAFGIGFVLRGYVREDCRGFYGELGSMGIAQTDKFEGNSGGCNFMEEIGIGYLFKSDWSLSLKAGHISNAGLADHNSGVNWGSLGVGYSFRR